MVARPADLEVEPSVLITDDNDRWREALQELLEREGFRTLLAACGEEAVEVVQTEHLAVALIDFHMPRIDGLETIRRIRLLDERLPAVLMTAHPGDLPRAEVQRLQVTQILEKSADRERIVTVILSVARMRW